MAATLRTRTGSEFSNLPTDGRKTPIQVGNYFTTLDATASPQASPLSYSSVVITIVVPQGAIQMVCFPSTDMRISEVSNAANYDIIPAGTKEVLSCAQMSKIYIVRDSADGSLRFKFIFV